MVVIVVPHCPVCKTSKNVVMTVADVESKKTWFNITYCTGCYTVISCSFRGRLLDKKDSSLKELNKMAKGLESDVTLNAKVGRGMSTAMLVTVQQMHLKGYKITEVADDKPDFFKTFRCKKCKAKCFYTPGIGPCCSKCGRDWGLEEIKQKEVHKK